MSLFLQNKDQGAFLSFDLGNIQLILNNMTMLNLINSNLANNRFALYYHPIYQTKGEISHYECLIRMLDGEGNLIYPDDFLPYAELSGLITQIDYWVIQEAINVLKMKSHLKLFVNISGNSLSSVKLLEDIQNSIIASGINPQRLGFEITETSTIRNLDTVIDWIIDMKKLGCSFALDDFGSGVSSFIYLSKLPIDYLKIDGLLIKDIHTNTRNLTIVKGINSIAHSFGIKTIAEYVENIEILKVLDNINVDYCQGYFFSKPLTVNQIP